MSLYNLFKTIAFKLDPENAHNLAIYCFEHFPWIANLWTPEIDYSKYSLVINGNEWSFPVGLAAGVDENARAIDFFSRLLFGAVEVGTVTPRFQIGNDRPRLWRYPEKESLRNCMGFNNYGASVIYDRIKNSSRNNKILGVNLGKNKITSQDKAHEEYCFLYEKFAPTADYLIINVSSPNTPGLRDLQKKDELERIFSALERSRKNAPKPLYLKISPDSNYEGLAEVIELAKVFGLAGIIATNTTIMTELGPGGVSGKLLSKKAKEVRKFVLDRTREVPHMEVIGVGGISSFDDIWDFWKDGGKVLQIFSSFIFQGPPFLKKTLGDIDKVMAKNGVTNLRELLDHIDEAQKE